MFKGRKGRFKYHFSAIIHAVELHDGGVVSPQMRCRVMWKKGDRVASTRDVTVQATLLDDAGNVEAASEVSLIGDFEMTLLDRADSLDPGTYTVEVTPTFDGQAIGDTVVVEVTVTEGGPQPEPPTEPPVTPVDLWSSRTTASCSGGQIRGQINLHGQPHTNIVGHWFWYDANGRRMTDDGGNQYPWGTTNHNGRINVSSHGPDDAVRFVARLRHDGDAGYTSFGGATRC